MKNLDRRPRFIVAALAFLIFLLLDLGFLLCGFPYVYRLIRSWTSRPRAGLPETVERRIVYLAVDAVRSASRCYYRRRLDCLPRALTLYVLLRCAEVAATLRIGVKRYPFAAHAWVEWRGEVLDESTNAWRHEPYVPILTM